MLHVYFNRTRNKWNIITIRMGKLLLAFAFYSFNLLVLAVYVWSPAAYKVLESFGILKLPSKSTMQSFTGAFMHEPRASSVHIADQVAQYVTFVEEP